MTKHFTRETRVQGSIATRGIHIIPTNIIISSMFRPVTSDNLLLLLSPLGGRTPCRGIWLGASRCLLISCCLLMRRIIWTGIWDPSRLLSSTTLTPVALTTEACAPWGVARFSPRPCPSPPLSPTSRNQRRTPASILSPHPSTRDCSSDPR